MFWQNEAKFTIIINRSQATYGPGWSILGPAICRSRAHMHWPTKRESFAEGRFIQGLLTEQAVGPRSQLSTPRFRHNPGHAGIVREPLGRVNLAYLREYSTRKNTVTRSCSMSTAWGYLLARFRSPPVAIHRWGFGPGREIDPPFTPPAKCVSRTMRKHELTLACGRYDRTQPLIDGRVQPESVDLTFLPLRPGETFWRMLNHGEFDASECRSRPIRSCARKVTRRHPGLSVAGFSAFCCLRARRLQY